MAGLGLLGRRGCIALAMIRLPYIGRATELAVSQVSRGLHEAAQAPGARDAPVVLRVVRPAAVRPRNEGRR